MKSTYKKAVIMKQLASGRISENITVAGNYMYPCYVIQGGRKILMIEAGLNLMGPLYVKSIEEMLGSRDRLDYLFLTHSHYDHLGAAHYLKRLIPGLTIGAHERVAGLLRKESVLSMMNRLSEVQRFLLREIAGDEDLTIRQTDIGLTLKEGDEIDLGGLSCRVYEVPGHTKDSLAYFIPEIGALFTGEAAGVPQGMDDDTPQVGFLASYGDYLASMEKLMSLNPEILCLGHAWVFTGEDGPAYLRSSFAATFEYRRLIEEYLQEADGDLEKTVETMAGKEYDEKGTIRQERNAYLTNLSAQVKLIAAMNGH
jgi:2-aminobenzoylacetyl-CoA thioesterase